MGKPRDRSGETEGYEWECFVMCSSHCSGNLDVPSSLLSLVLTLHNLFLAKIMGPVSDHTQSLYVHVLPVYDVYMGIRLAGTCQVWEVKALDLWP